MAEIWSVVGYVVVMAVLLLTGVVIARFSSFYRNLLNVERPEFTSIDGLRGVLAFAVFFHHAVVSREYAIKGVWALPVLRWEGALGSIGVGMFFMITGFLFWNKILRSEGRLESTAFFRARIRRMVPMYFFSVACVVVIVFIQQGGLQTSLLAFLSDVTDWLGFGLYGYPDINGFQDTRRIVGYVYWTLLLEWQFYLALPILALFHKPRAFLLMLPFGYFFLARKLKQTMLLCFVVGMSGALLVRYPALSRLARKPVFAVVGVAAIGLLAARLPVGLGHLQIVLLGALFLPVALGNDLGGLLATNAARMLGTISYSAYLLHATVLFVGEMLVPTESPNLLVFWLRTSLTGIVVVVCSGLSYRYVEHPFLRRSAGAQPHQKDVAELRAGAAAQSANG